MGWGGGISDFGKWQINNFKREKWPWWYIGPGMLTSLAWRSKQSPHQSAEFRDHQAPVLKPHGPETWYAGHVFIAEGQKQSPHCPAALVHRGQEWWGVRGVPGAASEGPPCIRRASSSEHRLRSEEAK